MVKMDFFMPFEVTEGISNKKQRIWTEKVNEAGFYNFKFICQLKKLWLYIVNTNAPGSFVPQSLLPSFGKTIQGLNVFASSKDIEA
jgi:hypothetical protein